MNNLNVTNQANTLALHNGILTMSSLDIASLLKCRHDNVKRSIERLVEKGVISHPPMEDGEKAANGVVEQHYRLSKRDSIITVAQLSPEFTAALVDRWQELEDKLVAPQTPALSSDMVRTVLHTELDKLNQTAHMQTAVLHLQNEMKRSEAFVSKMAEHDGIKLIMDMAAKLNDASVADLRKSVDSAMQKFSAKSDPLLFVLDTRMLQVDGRLEQLTDTLTRLDEVTNEHWRFRDASLESQEAANLMGDMLWKCLTYIHEAGLPIPNLMRRDPSDGGHHDVGGYVRASCRRAFSSGTDNVAAIRAAAFEM